MKRDSDTVSLVCEGACNPDVTLLDSVVRDARFAQDGSNREGHEPLNDERLVARLRRLVYTSHVGVGGHVYRCETCGHNRRFGRAW